MKMQLTTVNQWVQDQDEALEFYTETLAMELRMDVTVPEMGNFRWLTVGPGGQPYTFKLGTGLVIPGWDAGVQGMKVGGRRRLTIPSAMAYGARGAGGVIAPHEPLVFVVDLLSVD